MLTNSEKIFTNLKKVFENCLETVIESRDCMNESNKQLVEKYFTKFIDTENGYAYVSIRRNEDLNEEIKNVAKFLKELDLSEENIIVKAMIKQVYPALTYNYFK